MKKMLIMIAGPYRSGTKTTEEQQLNLIALNKVAFEVFKKGHIPVIGVNLALPIIEVAGEEFYSDIMMPLSLAIAEKCDAVLRIGGESKGADEEMNLIKSIDGTIFQSLDDIPISK